MNIFVGNLDFRVDELKLKDLFCEHGKVASVKIVLDQFTGRSRGFAFIEMDNEAEGLIAIKRLNGIEINQRPITVKRAVIKNAY